MSILNEIEEAKVNAVTTTNKNTTLNKLISIISSCSINLLLPFLNGLMLGFGELCAHEYSWNIGLFSKTKENSPQTFKIYRKKSETI